MNGKIKKGIEAKSANMERLLDPDFPRIIQFEVTNACNQNCVFCSLSNMNRPIVQLSGYNYNHILNQAAEMGVTHVGFTAGAEPMCHPALEQFLHIAFNHGAFTYIYLTSNGTVGNSSRWEMVGMFCDSIKISINAFGRKNYEKIHGYDGWISACRTVDQLIKMRTPDYPHWTTDKGKSSHEFMDYYLAVSFIRCSENADQWQDVKEKWEKRVDEVICVPVDNQSGRMPQYPTGLPGKCNHPWRRIGISAEGYMRLCCGDMDNETVIAHVGVGGTSLKDAYYGKVARKWRRKHLENDLKGTLCERCLG